MRQTEIFQTIKSIFPKLYENSIILFDEQIRMKKLELNVLLLCYRYEEQEIRHIVSLALRGILEIFLQSISNISDSIQNVPY